MIIFCTDDTVHTDINNNDNIYSIDVDGDGVEPAYNHKNQAVENEIIQENNILNLG